MCDTVTILWTFTMSGFTTAYVCFYLFVRALRVKILDLLLDRCYEQMFVLCFDHITCGAQNEWGTVDT